MSTRSSPSPIPHPPSPLAPPSPLLDIADLRVWFPIRRGIIARTVGHVRAVDGVSLTLARGETLGIVGESGCGKTTLARAIVRLEHARSGQVRFEGDDLLAASPSHLRRLRRRIQIVFQDPFASLNPRMTAADIVTEGLLRHRLIAPAGRDAEAARLLGEVGLGADALSRYPHEFSGGQRQRISIARALSMRPALVICDEPVSALDVSVQAQVLNLLQDLRDRHALSYVFISHDLRVVRQIADRITVMYLGRIVETGPADRVLASPRHPYTQALVSAIPRVGRRTRAQVLSGDVPSPAHPPPGCPFHTRCPIAEARCRATAPSLEPVSPGHLVSCLRAHDPIRSSSTAMVESGEQEVREGG